MMLWLAALLAGKLYMLHGWVDASYCDEQGDPAHQQLAAIVYSFVERAT